MSLPRRDAARTRLGVVALTAVLLLAAGIAPALARSAGRGPTGLRDWLHRAVRTVTRRDDARMETLPGDTIVVFGPLRVTSPSGSQTLGVERFTASVLP